MAGQARSVIVLAILIAIVPFATALVPASANAQVMKHFMPTAPAGGATMTPLAANDLIYHGGPIQKAPKAYLVFWGWNQPDADPYNVAPYAISFFSGLGGSGYASMQTEYSSTGQGFITNPSNQLGGVWFDPGPLPLTIPDEFLVTEARNAATHFGGADENAAYIIFTPYLRGSATFTSPLYGYCAWHSYTTDGFGKTIAYTNMPYVPEKGAGCGAQSVNGGSAGTLDGVSIVAGHEYIETVTDPRLNAWYDSNGAENADKCAWVGSGPGRLQNIVLSTGTFAVQGSWSNAAGGCVIHYP